MVILFNKQLEEEYLKNDMVLGLVSSCAQAEDSNFTSHRWLIQSLPKRLIYYCMYRDLLFAGCKALRILDVGGGYTPLSRVISEGHDYYTLDIMAHDDQELLREIEVSLGKRFWINSDWYNFTECERYDLVIANDLFPNVDQRLKLFMDKYLPACREMRLSLTYYNTPRWYKVKRTDADEILHMMAWDGMQLKRILEKYYDQINEPKFKLLVQNEQSLFSNERQVCLVSLRGKENSSWKQ